MVKLLNADEDQDQEIDTEDQDPQEGETPEATGETETQGPQGQDHQDTGTETILGQIETIEEETEEMIEGQEEETRENLLTPKEVAGETNDKEMDQDHKDPKGLQIQEGKWIETQLDSLTEGPDTRDRLVVVPFKKEDLNQDNTHQNHHKKDQFRMM